MTRAECRTTGDTIGTSLPERRRAMELGAFSISLAVKDLAASRAILVDQHV
jgi:hypothetical protein